MELDNSEYAVELRKQGYDAGYKQGRADERAKQGAEVSQPDVSEDNDTEAQSPTSVPSDTIENLDVLIKSLLGLGIASYQGMFTPAQAEQEAKMALNSFIRSEKLRLLERIDDYIVNSHGYEWYPVDFKAFMERELAAIEAEQRRIEE